MAIRDIRAGELNKRIDIKGVSEAPNASFSVDAAYSTGLSRWAKHEPIHGLVIRAEAQISDVPTDLFWVRRGTGTQPYDITQAHVVEWKGRRYRVVDTIIDGRLQEFTRISAKDLGAIA